MKTDTQYIIVAMIVMLICLVLLTSCSKTHRHAAGSEISIELPHTQQDAQKGGAV